MMIRSYSELIEMDSFEDRFEYLRIRGRVGEETFGFERYLNQKFYTSFEWRKARETVIARDLGHDLGVAGLVIHDRLIVHHMNPMVTQDIIGGRDDILNPEYLICTSHDTHNAIHYGRDAAPRYEHVARTPGDTKLW